MMYLLDKLKDPMEDKYPEDARALKQMRAQKKAVMNLIGNNQNFNNEDL